MMQSLERRDGFPSKGMVRAYSTISIDSGLYNMSLVVCYVVLDVAPRNLSSRSGLTASQRAKRDDLAK